MKFFGTAEVREFTAPPCMGSPWGHFSMLRTCTLKTLVVSETYRCHTNSPGTLDALVIPDTMLSQCQNLGFGKAPVFLTPKLPGLRQASATT